MDIYLVNGFLPLELFPSYPSSLDISSSSPELSSSSPELFSSLESIELSLETSFLLFVRLSFFFGDSSCFTGLPLLTLLPFARSPFLAGFLGDYLGPSFFWLRVRLGAAWSLLKSFFFFDFFVFGEGWASSCRFINL